MTAEYLIIDFLELFFQKTCRLSNGGVGLCCPTVTSVRKSSLDASSRNNVDIETRSAPSLPSNVDENLIEQKLASLDGVTKVRSSRQSGHGLNNNLRKDDEEYADFAFKLLQMSIDEDLGIAPRQSGDFGINSENSIGISNQCPYKNSRRPRCDFSSKYRNTDGSCNNQV